MRRSGARGCRSGRSAAPRAPLSRTERGASWFAAMEVHGTAWWGMLIGLVLLHGGEERLVLPAIKLQPVRGMRPRETERRNAAWLFLS